MSFDSTPAVLIVSPAWVGDALMSQSLLKLLKRTQPKLDIDVLAPTSCADIFQRMSEVRQVIPHTIAHGELAWQVRRRLGKNLRANRYQQAIILPNSWKSALIPFFARIPQRTGYTGEMRYGLLNDRRKLDKLILRKTVEQFAALNFPKGSPLRCDNIPRPRLSPASPDFVLQRLRLSVSQRPILALCPGAEYGPAKQWPLEYFAEVAKKSVAEGWQVWVFGSPKDAAIGLRIQTVVGGTECINLCGQTQLVDAVDLLALTRAVITNDSGLMHVAAALEKPLIALFGSSDPNMTPPLSNQAQTLHLRLKCSPCFARTCRYKHHKHLKCLKDIKPEQVLEKLRVITSSM